MKNLSTILKLSLITFIILFSNACKNKNKDCKKDGSCPPEYHKFPLGEAKNYLYSLKGSYWIYKNTVTGELDTQTCTGFICDTFIVKGTQGYSPYITVEYERIKRTIWSTFNKWQYTDETGFYNPNALRPLKTNLERESSKGGSIIAFLHPFIINDIDGIGISATTCQGMDSSMTIQGKTYINVAKFDIDIDGIWENSPPFTGSRYYWAKDIGLIKRTATHKPDNWELIEYNIIK